MSWFVSMYVRVDSPVRPRLSRFYPNQMEVLRDAIKRDMEEVAAEASAASTERSKIASELAERAERISQLGSSIHDLQVLVVLSCPPPMLRGKS